MGGGVDFVMGAWSEIPTVGGRAKIVLIKWNEWNVLHRALVVGGREISNSTLRT